MKSKSMFARVGLCFLIAAGAASSQVRSKTSILEPTVFAPGVISTGDYECVPEFSRDGKTLYFVKSTPDANFWTIVFSRFVNGRWSQPQVAPFSGKYSDADQFITVDGKQMSFISRRPVDPGISPNAVGKLDIWVIDKTETGDWSEPKNLGSPINSEASEFFPTLTGDGTLYFGSGRKGGKGGIDFYRSRLVNGKYQEPENLGDAINTTFDEFEPYIAPDESFLIFMAAGRPDGWADSICISATITAANGRKRRTWAHRSTLRQMNSLQELLATESISSGRAREARLTNQRPDVGMVENCRLAITVHKTALVTFIMSTSAP